MESCGVAWFRCRSGTAGRGGGGDDLCRRGELDVTFTPGHASHHVVYFDHSDGTAFVGDVAGVRIPPSDFVRPPTPPPDIDIDALAPSRSTWS